MKKKDVHGYGPCFFVRDVSPTPTDGLARQMGIQVGCQGNGKKAVLPQHCFAEEVMLPGTTDTNRKGFRPTRTDETTYLTRLHAYVGRAWYKKVVDIPESWKIKS